MVNGEMDLLKVLEFLHGQMEIGMKENTSMDLNTEKGHSFLQMAKFSREVGKMVINMAKDSSNLVIRLSKAFGGMDS